jgi:hypothetical protein
MWHKELMNKTYRICIVSFSLKLNSKNFTHFIYRKWTVSEENIHMIMPSRVNCHIYFLLKRKSYMKIPHNQ